MQKQRLEQIQDTKFLSKLRIIKRNLVFLSGIPFQINNVQILKDPRYLGQYGQIQSLYIANDKQKKFLNAYITYSNNIQASLAIIALDQFIINNLKISASFGMTQYCKFYLNNKICKNKKCNFYHQQAQVQDCCHKQDQNFNKHNKKIQIEQIIQYLINNYSQQQIAEEFKSLMHNSNLSVFPSIKQAYQKVQNYIKYNQTSSGQQNNNNNNEIEGIYCSEDQISLEKQVKRTDQTHQNLLSKYCYQNNHGTIFQNLNYAHSLLTRDGQDDSKLGLNYFALSNILKDKKSKNIQNQFKKFKQICKINFKYQFKQFVKQ